jgi:SAM-dependent MidA family methyltransferase
MSLRLKIQQEIRERGPIPFARYMELCLHDSEFGYYSRDAEMFGRAGDYYTSSDVHAVFGRLLARQFHEMWHTLDSPGPIELLELGPGRGLFAQDVLDWSEKKFPEFFRVLHYTLLERSPALRQRLKTTLGRHLATGRASLVDVDEAGRAARAQVARPPTQAGRAGSTHAAERPARLAHDFSPAEPLRALPRALTPEVPAIVFANEFFDALPIDVLTERGSLRIDIEDGRLVETWAPSSPDELEFLDRYGLHPEFGNRTEVSRAAQKQISQITASMPRGFLIAIDYGYTREQQLAGRHLGTVMTYRQHSASPNPYQAPGEQDITAHVNFSALAAAAEQGGMQPQRLRTQAQFLMGIGEANQFADAFEECRLPQERAKVALQLKHLVTPGGMGETFHVLVASKGVERDRVERLKGLSFGKIDSRA